MKLPQTFSALVVLLLIMISPVSAEMITRVVDGDTVDVRMPTGEIERIRLLCVNTPESVSLLFKGRIGLRLGCP